MDMCSSESQRWFSSLWAHKNPLINSINRIAASEGQGLGRCLLLPACGWVGGWVPISEFYCINEWDPMLPIPCLALISLFFGCVGENPLAVEQGPDVCLMSTLFLNGSTDTSFHHHLLLGNMDYWQLSASLLLCSFFLDSPGWANGHPE